MFVRHTSCDKCGSKDNRAVYADGGEHCFGCGDTKVGSEYNDSSITKKSKVRKEVNKVQEVEVKETKAVLTTDEIQDVKDETDFAGKNYRCISDEVYKYFGVRHAYDEDDNVIEQYYPCTQDGQLVGYKIREVPKDFYSKGRTGITTELFMQFRFNRGGKYLILTEGEVDALSAYQMLKEYNDQRQGDYEVAAVSSTVGKNATKQLAKNYKFLDMFDWIVVSYDNDKAGIEATEEIIKVLPKGKVKIMPMRYKDANEYLQKSMQKAFVADFYNAKVYTPVGVVGSSQLYNRILEQAAIQKVPFPPFMQKLNEMLIGGLPLGHIVNIAAGTGLGKCLAKGTLVRMYDYSLKKVEDIQNGDLVLGPDGNSRLVTGVTSGVDEMYKVDQVKGESYTVNASHILSLRASADIKSLGLKKGDIHNINVLDYLNLCNKHKQLLKGYKADMQRQQVACNDDWYIIGLWLSEGSQNKPSFTINNSDMELINFIKEYSYKYNYEITAYPSQYYMNCTTYDLTNGFTKVLNKLGIMQDEFVNDEFIGKLSYQQRVSLLAGFIDSDGYIADNGTTIALTALKNDILANSIVTLARSVGLGVTIDSVQKKWQSSIDKYQCISIYGDTAVIPNKLLRKKCSERKQVKNALNTGITITSVGTGEYFGFELTGNDKLFCLADFTVTHNTTYINEILYHWIFNSPHKLGIVSMELDTGQYGEVLLSRHLSRKISLIKEDDVKKKYLVSEEVEAKATDLFTKPDGSDRFFVLDNRDGTVEEIQDTIEELVISCGCKIIILDPLQDVLDGLSNEEQAVFMKWCKGLIKSHKVTLVFINHIRKSQGGGANSAKGDSYTEEEIQGSSTIIKSASINILLSRNKYAEDEIERNTTNVMLSKNRVCGITGPAGKTYYENETHTLHDLDTWLNENGIILEKDF